MFIFHAGKSFSGQIVAVRRFHNSPLRRFRFTENCKNQEKAPPKENVCGDPPVAAKPLSRKLLTASGVALAGTALAVYGTKNDDDLREWVKDNVPALDGLVKVVYQEEETYLEFLLNSSKQLNEGIKTVLYNVFQGLKETEIKSRAPAIEPQKEKIKKAPIFEPPKSAFATEDENSKSKVPENMKHLKELEDILFKNAQETMETYSLATEAVKETVSFTDNLDQMVSRHDCKVWAKFQKRSEDVQNLSEKFDNDFNKVKESAENLRLQMDQTPDLSWDVIRNAEQNITIVVDSVTKAKENLSKDKTLSKLSNDKVRNARLYFYDTLETFFPNERLDDEKRNIPKDNIPQFLEFLVQRIKVAEKDLNKLQTIRQAEVNHAVKMASNDNSEDTKLAEKDIVNIFVKIESEKESRLQREELKKTMQINNSKCEKINRESLKKLTEVYGDLKNEALTMYEREIERKMEQQLQQKLVDLRADHQLEKAKMVGRIQGANEAIASRSDNEKGHQVKQRFWSATQNLLSAVNEPVGPRSLKNEISNVTNAAPDGDKLVEQVVGSLRPEAIERGVCSEECLKKRFLQVEKQLRYLAGVPAEPVLLVKLALSRIQSGLYIDEHIPESELNNEPINTEELNNYEILYRARHYVNRGDLQQAVKYLNLLKGPSKTEATKWTEEVVMYCETLQAAQALLGHASSLNQ